MIGEKVTITFDLLYDGRLSFQVLDRDGYLIRDLLSGRVSQKGRIVLQWDGKGNDGKIVPDEAYSFRIDLDGASSFEPYFPANRVSRHYDIQTKYYDRQSGILTYQLPKPSRVHIQAGSAVVDESTREIKGPVLRTIVNRAPRAAGSVVEHWEGYNDQTLSIYIPDVPHFVVAIAASELPENSVITVGNDAASFLELANQRQGKSLFTYTVDEHRHHQGLTSLEDVSPQIRVTPVGAHWSDGHRAWILQSGSLSLKGRLQGPNTETFSRLPGEIFFFIDQEKELEIRPNGTNFDVRLSVDGLTAGRHIIAINWATLYGPVSVVSFPIVISKPQLKTTTER